MPDAALLAEWGRLSVSALWLPLAAWTALALVVEGALRLGRADAAVGLPVREAALAALPVALAVPAALGALAPDAAAAVAVLAPAVTWLPEVVVGGGVPEVTAASGPPAADVLLGLLAVAAGLAGAVALVRLGHGALGLRRVRRTLEPAPPGVQVRLDAACARLGVRRPVAAATATAGTVPFTLGWRRPLVAVPAGLDGDALDVALAHEAAHVRRADFAWHAAQRVLTAAFAAHPLVHALGRGLDLDRERAADAAVLDACPGRRRAYARLLLSYAQHPAPPFALGAAPGSSTLKRRIDAMTNPLPPRRRRQLGRRARLAGLLTLALAAGLAAATAPGTPDTPARDQAPSDSTISAIDRVDVRKRDGGPSEIDVRLKPGYGRDTAEAVAEEVTDGSDGEGEPVRLTVRYEGGAVERMVRVSSLTLPPGAAVRVPGPPQAALGGLPLSSDLVESADVRRESGGTVLDLVLKDGATTADAEPLADEVAGRPGVARVRVRLADGRVVERTAPTGPLAPRDTTDEVFEVAEEMPELIGGLEALEEAVVYPPEARAENVQGRVIVQFIVDEEGRVTEPAVERSPDDRLSEAALAAVRTVRFRPGRQRGGPVRVRFALPVTFQLPGGASAQERARERMEETREMLRNPPPPDAAGVYDVAEVQPELIGGLEALQERLVYPEAAKEAGVQGRVIVQFVIDEEGRVVDPVAVRSPSEAFSEAALAAVRQARFRPGRMRGEPVKVRFSLPITFRLPDGE